MTCEPPNAVGRIVTTSTYTVPRGDGSGDTLTIENFALFGPSGTYFTETVKTAGGEPVGYTSGVTIPASDGQP